MVITEQAIKIKYLRIIIDHKFELSKQHKLRDWKMY